MRNLELIFEELNHIEYMVKENASPADSELVYEAFWFVVNEGIGSWLGKAAGKVVNVVGGAAKAVTGAVTGAVDWAKQLGEKVWGKIKELGQEFLNFVTEVKNKISQVVNWVKEAPGKALEQMNAFWGWLSEKVGAAIAYIKKGIDTFFTVINTVVFQPIVNAYKNTIINVEQGLKYAQGVGSNKLKEMSENINKFKGKCGDKWDIIADGLAKIVVAIPDVEQQIIETLKKIGKGIGYVILGIILAPFAVAFLLGKGAIALGGQAYKLGEMFVNTISAAVGDFKQFAAQEVAAAKTAYKETTAPAQPVAAPITKVGENIRTVLSFNDFLKRG